VTTAWIQRQEAQMLYSTATFRRLIDSAARPGKLNQLAYPEFLGEPPFYWSNLAQTERPVNLYALGTLLTLLDSEVSFILAANGQELDLLSSAVQWVTLRSGAKLAELTVANFGLFCDGTSDGLLTTLDQGSVLEPELSATAIYCVEQLSNGPASDAGVTLELSGPGIATTSLVSIVGLSLKEPELFQITRRDYPLGVDVFIVDAAGQCLGLPRSTKIKDLSPAPSLGGRGH